MVISLVLVYTAALSLAAGAQVSLLYLGPETVMPLASILAAIVGVLLLFWRLILGFFKRIFKFIAARFRRDGDPQPEFEVPQEDTLKDA